QLQRQLLEERRRKQEIDQATYEQMLALLQSLEGTAAPSAETPTMPTVAPLTPNPSPQRGEGGTRGAGDATPFPQTTEPLGGTERPRQGMQVGDYRLEARLGAGGMGEVWKASDLVGERLVVLKFLVPEF